MVSAHSACSQSKAQNGTALCLGSEKMEGAEKIPNQHEEMGLRPDSRFWNEHIADITAKGCINYSCEKGSFLYRDLFHAKKVPFSNRDFATKHFQRIFIDITRIPTAIC